jgi:DNA-binding MarR family transcriptional regulator
MVLMMHAPANKETVSTPESHWTFLTNHAAVLLHLASHPDDTMRSVAASLGLTERTTAAVIADLRAAGYITVRRRGRHNHYTVKARMPLRREAHIGSTVGDLLKALGSVAESGAERTRTTSRKREQDKAVSTRIR